MSLLMMSHLSMPTYPSEAFGSIGPCHEAMDDLIL
jgi:hypothetical protein